MACVPAKIAAHVRDAKSGAQVATVAKTVSLWADFAPALGSADVLMSAL